MPVPAVTVEIGAVADGVDDLLTVAGFGEPMTAPPVGALRDRPNDSLPSYRKSRQTVRTIGFVVSPAAKLTVPDAVM
ncbi:MAG: hypothetical protein IPJ30_25605 [Acidobacteria bacterium]|nr:hypothetical protein [Acidobacteriota bacterium]